MIPGWGHFYLSVNKSSRYFQCFELVGQEKRLEIDFQDGNHDGHLGFSIRSILAIFDQEVIPILPIKFQVNRSFHSGGEGQNRCLRWRPSWISDWNDFSYF